MYKVAHDVLTTKEIECDVIGSSQQEVALRDMLTCTLLS